MSIKAVMFDFDGTLSAPENSNIWNDFWDILDYERTPGSEYARLGGMFFGGEIDYQTWCDLTCEKFMERGFSRSQMLECANKIKMLNNVGDAFDKLIENGVKIGICSGNCTEVIVDALKEDYSKVDIIQANELIFDDNDKLTEIYARFDCYEGKARFIESFIKENDLNPQEVLFVGNGENDEWAYLSGVKTLCINPEPKVHKDDRTIWNGLIENTDTLLSVVDYVEQENSKESQNESDCMDCE